MRIPPRLGLPPDGWPHETYDEYDHLRYMIVISRRARWRDNSIRRFSQGGDVQIAIARKDTP